MGPITLFGYAAARGRAIELFPICRRSAVGRTVELSGVGTGDGEREREIVSVNIINLI